MFNKLSTVASVFLLGSVVLSAGKAQAQSRTYTFDDFNPGNGPITASGFFTISDTSNIGIVDFPNELIDWQIELTNTDILDSNILTTANSGINRVTNAVGETLLPYLEGVTVTDTVLDFGTANNLLPAGFSIQATDNLIDDKLLITTTLGPILRTSTETIILTSDIPDVPLVSVPSGFSGDIPLNAITDAESSATVNGGPTLQATAAAVPFEFSPSLGLLMIGSAWGILRVQKVTKSKVKL